jgi:DtxR family Mn-dependent transcriptional regulator
MLKYELSHFLFCILVVVYMSGEVTEVVEEYLEDIYRLQERMGVARTSDIVELLQVVPGTVTNTIERLEKEGLVIHEPYKGVKLTEKGRRIALHIIRQHRLSERLLTDILHVDWSEVHKAACRLEHDITGDIIKKLEETLGHPKTCPHGNPIPTECGGIIEEESQPLIELNEKEQGEVVKITDEKSELLQYLGSIGLVPGASIKIFEKAPLEGPITLKVGGVRHAISREVASTIKVKRVA